MKCPKCKGEGTITRSKIGAGFSTVAYRHIGPGLTYEEPCIKCRGTGEKQEETDDNPV